MGDVVRPEKTRKHQKHTQRINHRQAAAIYLFSISHLPEAKAYPKG